MAYTKGSTYIWSDGEHLHIWAEQGLDDWQSMLQYEGKPNASGVQISDAIADQFAIMRFAELLKSRQGAAVMQQTLAQWGGNFGCAALEELASVIHAFCVKHDA